MKKFLALSFLGLFLMSHSQLWGQIDDFGVFKNQRFVQISNSAPVLSHLTNGSPYTGGSDPGPFYLATFDNVTPNGTTSTLTTPLSDSPLTYVSGNGANQQQYWSSGYATQANLDTAYPNNSSGGYGISSTAGNSGPLSITGDLYPNTFQITEVNGNTPVWSGNQLVLNPDITNTLTWTPFSAYDNSVGAHIQFELYTPTGSPNVFLFHQAFTGPNASHDDFSTYEIPANTLSQGGTFDVFIEYDRLTTRNVLDDSNYGVGGYETGLFLTIDADGVPEPSVLWMLSLGLVSIFIWSRSRRATVLS